VWDGKRIELPDVSTDELGVENMDYIVATGYGRAIVPFAHSSVTEISCHGCGAHWFVPAPPPSSTWVARTAGDPGRRA
jgi:hypothetical protein